MTSLTSSDKFKINFIDMIDDLCSDFASNQKLLSSLETIKSISEVFDGDFIISSFLRIINDKKRQKTLKEEYVQGNYFYVLQNFLDEIALSTSLELNKEIKISDLSDSQKDTYIDYLQSFFKISENYLKEKK